MTLAPPGDGAASPYCRTCRRALHRYTTPGGTQTLLHAIDLRGGKSDHMPDPVPLGQLPDPVMECDVCSGTDVAFVYRCADQDTEQPIITSRTVGAGDYRDRHSAARALRTESAGALVNRWGTTWTTCPDCARLVERRDVYGLISRATETLPGKYRHGRRLAATRGQLHAAYSIMLATLVPGRGRIIPGHPLGVWEPAQPDTPDPDRPSAQDGA